MSIFNAFKKAFGFDHDHDLEIDGIDATVTPLAERQKQQQQARPQPSEYRPKPQISPTPSDSGQLTIRIFESVIKIFNESLPSFLRDSIDPEAQKRYLFDALDQSVKEALANVEDEARKRMRAQIERDRQRYESEARELRNHIKAQEETQMADRQKALSAERQKRALNERIRDLENQVNVLLAEKEQFELEKSSLMNKIRLTSLQASDAPVPDEKLLEQVEQMKAKIEIADRMVNEFKTTASKSVTELDSVKNQLNDSRKTIEEQTEVIHNLQKTVDNQKVEIDDLNDALGQLDEVSQAIDRFEKIKADKDKRIKELTTESIALNKKIDEQQAEIQSLKDTIAANLHAQANSEGQLRREIDMLKEQPEDTKPAPPKNPEPKPAPKPETKKPRKSKPVITAIDEELDDTDWLVSTPAPGVTLTKDPDPEFGYTPPERKPMPDNEAQMTLF